MLLSPSSSCILNVAFIFFVMLIILTSLRVTFCHIELSSLTFDASIFVLVIVFKYEITTLTKEKIAVINMLYNKGQCATGPRAMTVQSSKQLIVKLHAKNQEILERGSEYNFEKVHFEPKFDLLTPIGPGQEFSRRQHIHSLKCLISV